MTTPGCWTKFDSSIATQLMPFAFDFDSAHRILRCRFRGRVTDEELTKYLRIVGQYVTLIRPRGGITDFSDANATSPPRAGLFTSAPCGRSRP
jgi:hypothetical protein